MSDSALEMRGCRSREELEEVVSLCDAAFPKTSREYFARHVLKDRTLAPADTRILVKDGKIVSSVQVFPRTMHCRGEKIGFGGIGNVATLPSEREKGYAGRVLRDALEYIRNKKLPVSLLTTTINSYYEKFGFQTIQRHVVLMELPGAGEHPGVRPFDRARDLRGVMELYNRFNTQFIGSLVRDAEYWDSQLEFCDEDKSLFYVCETEGDLRGFVRARKEADHVQVLEYGFAENQQEILPGLLEHLARGAGERRVKLFASDNEWSYLSFGKIDGVRADTDMMVSIIDPDLSPEVRNTLKSDYQLTFWLTDFF
jgi:predicted N-acetyltransferase YhbS